MGRLSTTVLAALLGAAPLALAAMPQAAPACGPRHRDQEARNKAVVARLCAGLYGDEDPEALGRLFAEDCIQHDPAVQNGRRGAVAWIRSLRAQSPAQSLSVKHLLADGDRVLVHAQVTATPSNPFSGTAGFDLYRLDKGRIVEHWAVRCAVPSRSASGNTLFSDLYAYPAPPAPATEEAEALNRSLAADLSARLFQGRQFGLLDRFWAPGYLQHNPYVGNGRAALASVIEYIAPEGGHYRVAAALAEGDLAFVYAQRTDPGTDPSDAFAGAAVGDLYRMVDLEMVEHWDAFQAVPATSVNGNSMFSDLYCGR